MTAINITYTSKRDTRYDKSFKALVFVNGKFHYHTERNKKSNTGALKVARRVAEGIGSYYNSQNVTKTIYNVTVDRAS